MKRIANNTFDTEIEISLDGPGIVRDKVKLKWSYDMETRVGMGIKSILPIVPEQTIKFSVEHDDEDEPKVSEQTLKIDDPKIEYEGSGHSLALFPTLIQIYKGKATITFHRG